MLFKSVLVANLNTIADVSSSPLIFNLPLNLYIEEY